MIKKSSFYYFLSGSIFILCFLVNISEITAFNVDPDASPCPDQQNKKKIKSLDTPLTLAKLIDISSIQSKEILEGRWNIELDKMALRSTLSSYYPSADVISNIHYSNFTELDNIGDAFNATLNISWNIFSAWKIFFKDELINKSLKAERFRKVQIKKKSRAKAIALYYDYWASHNKMETVRFERSLLEKDYSNAKFAFKNDIISKKELQNMKRKWEGSVWRYEESSLTLEQSKKKLLSFIFLSLTTKISPPPDLKLPSLQTLENAIDTTLETSENILLSKRQVEEAKKAVKKAKYKRWTNFSTSFYVGNSISLDHFNLEDESNDFNYGADFSWHFPLFDAGYYKRLRRQSEISYEKAVLEHDELPGKIIEKVAKMWRSLIEKKKNIELTTDLLENTKKEFEIIKLKFDSGDISKIEMDKAIFELQKMNTDLLQNNYEYIVMHANMDFFCGYDIEWIKETLKQN
ncbi:MAG: TolC family protein [Candidatus Aureabacteria bacterium]|nr:TolC family protein [Candidatus Auribacterota bacterium]